MNHDMRIRKASTSREYRYGPEVEFRNVVDLSKKPHVTPPPDEYCRNKLSLAGPFSPLESELHSMSRFARKKNVGMDQNSVNAIVLNTEPQERLEKLYVAATVSDNKENKLTLRETTAMPSIPGMSVLMALIFSPTCEIRTNSDRTRYTTILTGLGADPETKDPFFAEHDSLFRVDVELDSDDFAGVCSKSFEKIIFR